MNGKLIALLAFFCGIIVIVGVFLSLPINEQFILLDTEFTVEQRIFDPPVNNRFVINDYNLTVFVFNNGTSDDLTIIVTIMHGKNSWYGTDQKNQIFILINARARVFHTF